MMHEVSHLRFILRSESNSVYVSKWCLIYPIKNKWHVSLDPNDIWLMQARVSGTCPLICWCVPYACVSSNLQELLCISGTPDDVWSGYCPSNKSTNNMYKDFATGSYLSLTTDHMSWSKPVSYNRPYVLIAFPWFWWCPMFWMQELL